MFAVKTFIKLQMVRNCILDPSISVMLTVTTVKNQQGFQKNFCPLCIVFFTKL